ncbi:MAG: Gfo/Idh/MocA family oxidoreductase [Planctomycetota bacterium]
MTTVAVAGAGRWGRNLVRNFATLPDCELRWVVEPDAGRRERVEAQYPTVRTSDRLDPVLADPDVEAVVVSAPARDHHAIGTAALSAGKHVYVEKPLALTLEDARDLERCAAEAERILMTGHLLLYHPAVLYLKDLIDRGELGDVYYLYSQRVNLGMIRRDENALWSFAPHDLSVMLHLLGEEPVSVSARGAAYIQPGIEDVVFVNLRFADDRMGQVQLSWLDPHKIRKFTVVGSKKMAVFDDTAPQEKIRVYDKGVDQPGDYATYGDSIGLRFGDVMIPRIDPSEPLRLECQEFIDCIRTGRAPRSDGASGVQVVRVLSAASESLARDGAPVELTEASR